MALDSLISQPRDEQIHKAEQSCLQFQGDTPKLKNLKYSSAYVENVSVLL